MYSFALAHTMIKLAGGVNKFETDKFQKDIDTAVSIPIHEEQLSKLKQLTTAKEKKITECIEWGEKLRLRMTLATKQK